MPAASMAFSPRLGWSTYVVRSVVLALCTHCSLPCTRTPGLVEVHDIRRAQQGARVRHERLQGHGQAGQPSAATTANARTVHHGAVGEIAQL